jgi:probable HAF family extracellular repeat protein
MKQKFARVRSARGKTRVLRAFTGNTSAAFNPQESGAAEQQRRDRHNELTFTQVDFPVALATVAFNANDRGQIVGAFIDAVGAAHGFLMDKGVFAQIDVDLPEASSTNAIGINDRGQIVGGFADPMGALHGFLLEDDVFTQIDFPGATETLLVGINDHGQIAGVFSDRDQIVGRLNGLNNAAGSHGFLLDDSAFTSIDFPGALGTVPFSINDCGRIVGSFIDDGGKAHGFLWDNGVFTKIDFPGATLTTGNGINKRGQIVGTFHDDCDVAHGYLLDDRGFTTIDHPAAAMTTEALRIDKRGQIVGAFIDDGGMVQSFLATKEQFSGEAIGVGSGAEKAAVEIVGTFTSPIDLDLSVATLTIASLLDERAGGGELARRLPLVLTPVPGSRRNLALFKDKSHPNFASGAILDAGSDKFIFKIKVNDVVINSPQSCSPTQLTTGFRLDASSKPPIVVSTEQSWICFGPSNKFLKTR